MSNRDISTGRQALYYAGMVLVVIGLLSFASTFVSAIANFGDFTDFTARTRSMMMRSFGGMALIITGGIIARLGALGAAGSGAVLNPQQARRDLEPYSRMAGGMVKDVLEDADISLAGNSKEVVKIRCRDCGKLNEDDSKFCQECGHPL